MTLEDKLGMPDEEAAEDSHAPEASGAFSDSGVTQANRISQEWLAALPKDEDQGFSSDSWKVVYANSGPGSQQS